MDQVLVFMFPGSLIQIACGFLLAFLFLVPSSPKPSGLSPQVLISEFIGKSLFEGFVGSTFRGFRGRGVWVGSWSEGKGIVRRLV